MSHSLKTLFARMRTNLLVRVLVVYLGASWLVLEVVDFLSDNLALPTWFVPAAIGLLLIGLPIILGTAVVQGALANGAPRRTDVALPDFELAEAVAERGEPAAASAGAPAPAPDLGRDAVTGSLGRWLTWKRSILGGVIAFTALGVVGTLIVARGTARVTEAYGSAGDSFEERAWLVVADFGAPADDPDVAIAVREALTVDLQQSQYLNVFTRDQVAGVLGRMGLPDTVTLDGGRAREIAQREGLAAVLDGQVSRLGNSYALAARVLEAGSGEELVAVRSTASDEKLVEAVEALSREIRARLGESRLAIHASKPLPRVTTGSLAALQRYAQAKDALERGDPQRAIDLAEAAVALDPEFAMAHRLAGVAHGNVGSFSERDRYIQQAYELRENLPERERLHIEAYHASDVRGDPVEAMAKYEVILAAYPDDSRAANNLAATASSVGDQELQFRSALRAIELDPYAWQGYSNAIWAAWSMDRPRAADSLMSLAASNGLVDRASRLGWLHSLYLEDWGRADAVCDSLLQNTANRGGFRPVDEVRCGSLDVARGRIARGMERLRSAASLRAEREQWPAHYSATNYLIHAALQRGDREAARRAFQDALANHPPDSLPGTDGWIAYLWVGLVARDLEDAELASWAASRTLTDTTQYWKAAWALRMQALEALTLGSYEEALELGRQAIGRDYEQSFNYDELILAEAFDGLGQPDSAIAHYEEFVASHSLALGPVSELRYLVFRPAAHRRLGELYSDQGMTEKAARHYVRYLELRSDPDPELLPQVESARRALDRLVGEGSG